jgi:hypothetical protein
MDYLKYILPICASILAILLLIKDWDALKYNYLRFSALGLIILLGFGGSLNSYFSEKRNDRQRQQDNIQLTKLQQALDTSEKNRQSNTQQFLTEFDRLSEKVNNLQTQVKTTEFKKKVTNLQADLESTRKALIAPKAALTFTFPKPHNDAPAIHAITLPVKDNVVHVDFTITNDTDTPALNGELTVIICKSCEFASESIEFKKMAGENNKRFYIFDHIFPKAILKNFSVDVRVPPSINSMQFGISYRCNTCIAPTPIIGTILLSR